MDPSTDTAPHIFFLVRHAETRGNITEIMLPPDEDELTELGFVQTELLGNALKDVHFTKAYSSPYIRTVQTTKVILKHNESSKDLPYKIDERIREIDYGGFVGNHYGIALNEISSQFERGISKSELTSKGSEKFGDMNIRAQSFMEDLVKDLNEEGKPETVLIVSHGVFITSFMEFLNDWDKVHVVNWDESCGKMMKNTTYMKFSISQQSDSNSKRELVLLNIHENSHMKESEDVCADALTKVAHSKDGDGLSGCFHV